MSIWIWPPQPSLAKSSAVWWHLEPQNSGGGHSHIRGTHWLGNLVYYISSRPLRDPNSCVCGGVIAPGEWNLKGSSVPHLKITRTHKHTHKQTHRYTDTHTQTKTILIQMKSLVPFKYFRYNLSSICLCFTSKLNISSWRNRLEGCKFSYFVLLWFSPSVI